jgi:hypothetical protein
MPRFSKQFALINKIKSLVKKTKINVFKRTEEYDITEDAAKKIQKKAYELRHTQTVEGLTKPYVVIADQLQINDDQIYRAVVSTLSKIAMNDTKSAKDIIELLNTSTTFAGKTNEQKNYVAAKVGEIKKVVKI